MKTLLLFRLSLLFSLVVTSSVPFSQKDNLSLRGNQKREPHPTKFLQPTQDQHITPGSSFHIKLIDGGFNEQKVRFVLRSATDGAVVVLTGPSHPDGLVKFSGFLAEEDVNCPRLKSGSYNLVAQGLSAESHEDMASVTIVVKPAAVPSARVEDQQSGRRSLVKRAPHPPVFKTPTAHQLLKAGKPLDIWFIDGEATVTQARFLLRSIRTPTAMPEDERQGVLLYGRSSTTEGVFVFERFSVQTRVLLPKELDNGTYYLVAQEPVTKDPGSKFVDVLRIEVQVVNEGVQTKYPSGDQTFNMNDDQEERITLTPAKSTTPNRIVRRETQSTEVARPLSFIEPRDTPEVVKQGKWSTVARESPSIIEPHFLQNIPLGSQFRCKVHDTTATSEVVKYLLRSFSGQEYYLGEARYKDGDATKTLTCPPEVKFDTYSLVVRQNSLKRPKIFLDVISTTVIISHPSQFIMSMQNGQDSDGKKTQVSQLITPHYNQFVPAGEDFECRFIDPEPQGKKLRFVIRFEDEEPDTVVGHAEFSSTSGATMCHIPSTVTSGRYTFIAQESLTSNPDDYEDVQSTVVLLGVRRYRRRSELVLSGRKDTGSIYLASDRRTAHLEHLAGPLLEPEMNQKLIRGHSFHVQIKDANFRSSTLIRFVLREQGAVSSDVGAFYELGTSSTSSNVKSQVMCPRELGDGPYNFIVQANSANEPEVFEDVLSTLVGVEQSTQGTSSAKLTLPDDP